MSFLLGTSDHHVVELAVKVIEIKLVRRNQGPYSKLKQLVVSNPPFPLRNTPINCGWSIAKLWVTSVTGYLKYSFPGKDAKIVVETCQMDPNAFLKSNKLFKKNERHEYIIKICFMPDFITCKICKICSYNLHHWSHKKWTTWSPGQHENSILTC